MEYGYRNFRLIFVHLLSLLTLLLLFFLTSVGIFRKKINEVNYYYYYYYYALNNGCNGFSFDVHCVEDGDRVSPLQDYGQALKQKDCFFGVLGDDCGASANLLD